MENIFFYSIIFFIIKKYVTLEENNFKYKFQDRTPKLIFKNHEE